HFARVLRHHRHQSQLVAALRDRQRHRRAALLPKPGPQRIGILWLMRQNQLAWHMWRLVVELLEEHLHDLALGRVTGSLQDEELTSGEPARAEEEDLRARLVVLARQRDHILVVGAGGVDDLLLFEYL